MSSHSQYARMPTRRLNSQQSVNGNGNGNERSQHPARPRKKSIDSRDAYSHALRAAYLAYLLQPRQKRTRVVQKQISKSSTNSVHEMMSDFQRGPKDVKSAKYPHDFVKALDKRLLAIIKNEDKRPDFQDTHVKRSFAIFVNQLADPTFRKSAEESKRAEELILMFYSKAITSCAASIQKPQNDEAVKRMVDRHLALFVRLLGMILKEKGWAEERKDLANKLHSLERKLLKHEQDLEIPTVEEGTVEEEVPLTYDVKDMPQVLTVGQIFGMRNSMLQSDIDARKNEWTEAAALRDLKTYQTHLNMGTHRTLNETDFDTKEAYEEWKKQEAPELSQMLLAIMQINPTLAKSSGATSLPQFNNNSHRASMIADGQYAELAKAMSPTTSTGNIDLPDLNGLNIDDRSGAEEDGDNIFTFIPSDARGTYHYIMSLALASDVNSEVPQPHILSQQSIDLMNELASRWRIPKFTRIVLFLDAMREKFVEGLVDLNQLDAAFNYAKEPVLEEPKNKRQSLVMVSVNQDRLKWTVADFSLMQQILSGLYNKLLQDLYGAMLSSYAAKQDARLGPILSIIDEHIKSDTGFHHSEQDFEYFKQQVAQGLRVRASEVYAEFVEKEIPGEQEAWEFYHIMQLGKQVLEKAEKIQKRFRRNPEILGVKPFDIFLECTMPAFAEDSKAMIEVVKENARLRQDEIPIDDGIELYRELVRFRHTYEQAVPDKPFPYKIEDLLQDFVWRMIYNNDSQIVNWVGRATDEDDFKVRSGDDDTSISADQRHSNSVLDVFRSFNQVTDRIVRLDWADPYTKAKFMTALSKSLGNGVARYCEMLQQKFRKEMERLSPEQEMAAAAQTTQQRYLQLAKDAWNNDTNVEPFQFYPESFVKLNNISFAIQQWDKMEAEADVDECVRAIAKREPPLSQKQATSQYVFTIKLVEAEGLKALDVNGFSDPYVVLTDEYQKRLFKTKTIYKNLNPRWDESVDIIRQGPINVIATVWDWDSMKDHDYVGRTVIKLDPAHFSDFLPREYWLNLDTQGRILVRISMEGERDDIQFHFGKAFRILQRTQRDMTRVISDKLSAYIHSCLSQKTLKQLVNKPLSVAKVSSLISSYRNRNSNIPILPTGPTENDIANALTPLFKYFDDNFFIMNQTLTPDAMLAVMTRLWKDVLMTIESLLVPPLSDLPSQQRQLSKPEVDIVFKWLQSLFEFFNAADHETGQVNGIPTNVLKSPKYHEIQSLNFFYDASTEDLVRTSERMASASAQSQSAQRSRLSAPAHLGAGAGSLLVPGAAPGARRAKSIMLARNLGTMKKAKEEKWKAAQTEPSDDMILRILRMRPEAAGYLRDRSIQKERLATQAAAQQIVRQSLMAGGGRMTGPSVMRR